MYYRRNKVTAEEIESKTAAKADMKLQTEITAIKYDNKEAKFNESVVIKNMQEYHLH